VAALVLGLSALGVLYQDEMRSAVAVWRASTAFSHCFLVLPVAAWLAWDRRKGLAGWQPQPLPWLGLLALPLAGVWLAAERLGVMEGRQFASLLLLWTLIAAGLGVMFVRVMAVPMAYLVFLVPFGAFAVPALQEFTARFIDSGLGLLAVPHLVSATRIEIPEGTFRVAEACAGLRFLIASIAFGTIYACVIYVGIWRRLSFIVAAAAVAVIANGVRALGIVMLGHLRGTAEAGAVDHVTYGWIFFSLVILLLLLLGLPFRQEAAAPAPALRRPVARSRLAAATAVGLVIAGAAAGPAASVVLERRALADVAEDAIQADRIAARLRLPAGCADTPKLPEGVLNGHRPINCNGRAFDVTVQVFSRRAGPSVLHAWRDATIPGDDEQVETYWLNLPGTRWRIAAARSPARMMASTLLLDGVAAPTGVALRLRLAGNAFIRYGSRAVLITITGPSGLEDILRAQPAGWCCTD